MKADSSPIFTNQTGVHDKLQARVSRALGAHWQRPIAAHSQAAFDDVTESISSAQAPLILDSGCGVGVSTRKLAERFPDHWVIGIDRSADRLSRDHGPVPDNARLVRADLVDIWRLALAARWQPTHHFLLYPNPYPKARHLKMRWHGHPVFPALVGLGGRLELRSNWQLYVTEFAQALTLANASASPDVAAFSPGGAYLTPFERKYDLSGQTLWRLHADLTFDISLLP
ncbi:tRNA (guanine(46)-N(7))-methyltransferase TrmB [Larsenimonas suaedae]|uniref:tRNA (guanine(46)-N(7))-methyltransferase n=1 Tax=Larsenimonas suaedae TaxID=1851019 RepID=A0ABU1GWS7_9GAMM|nr:SAM-dependent methyltransferase [Larsenimonas suaedae]MCM2973064.1 SAM-dependent methyltransferase [Larsenimonas suaedae]MDR5896501.1 SAM-dependent methyltransferase [Larsenimonas suaedae]